MTKLHIAGRALFAVLTLVALSACTVFSKDALVTESEVSTPLASTFAMLFYTEKPEGYVDDDEGDPQPFTLKGSTYEADDHTMIVSFVPRSGNQYLVAVNTQGTYLYGVAKLFDNNVIEVHLVMDEDYASVIKDKLGSAPAEVSSAVAVSEGGVEVTSRPALDFLVEMLAAGEIGAKPMVGYIAPSATDAFPKLITKDGDGWAVTN